MAEAELARVLTGIQGMLQQQAQATTQLAAQAAAVDDRFAQGEANLQSAMTGLESRLGDTERKLADALAALSSTMTGFRTGLEQRLAASDARLDAALNQLTTAMATSTPVPNPPGLASGPSQAAAGAQPSAAAAPPDPWAQAAAAAAAAAASPAQPGGGSQVQYAAWPSMAAACLTGSAFRTKDFMHITPFDGELARFPDWVDRVTAKLSKAHPRVEEVLLWAERQAEPITRDKESGASNSEVDVPSLSGAIYDVLLERTGPRLFDKRRNAGVGRVEALSTGEC